MFKMHNAKCMLQVAINHVIDLSGNKFNISEGSKGHKAANNSRSSDIGF